MLLISIPSIDKVSHDSKKKIRIWKGCKKWKLVMSRQQQLIFFLYSWLFLGDQELQSRNVNHVNPQDVALSTYASQISF